MSISPCASTFLLFFLKKKMKILKHDKSTSKHKNNKKWELKLKDYGL